MSKKEKMFLSEIVRMFSLTILLLLNRIMEGVLKQNEIKYKTMFSCCCGTDKDKLTHDRRQLYNITVDNNF